MDIIVSFPVISIDFVEMSNYKVWHIVAYILNS